MKKILVTSIGGLGNQMFCYAFYKKMCLEYPNVKFKMDLSEIWDARFEQNAEFLSIFPNIRLEVASAKEIWEAERKLTFKYRGKGSRLLRFVVDNLNKCIMKKKRKSCVTEEIFEKYGSKLSEIQWKKLSYFDGFWQKIDYYKDYISQLQKDFQFVEIKDEENKRYLQQIQKTESISVHVRRGDYVGEILDILDTDYYRKVIMNVQERFPNGHFYFFTNDATFVEKEYEWLENKTIVKNNVGIDSFRDMQLMSVCKHNIIANSTFSIWAALLNINPNRSVYYPSHYYRGIEMQEIDLDGFIRVNV